MASMGTLERDVGKRDYPETEVNGTRASLLWKQGVHQTATALLR